MHLFRPCNMQNSMWIKYKKLLNRSHLNMFIYVANKSHYEVLNITKAATHKEIKDAYYRLSMIYHPDKNKGCEEAAKLFRDITTAYEILGNVRQRKLYDSGAKQSQTSSYCSTAEPFETMNTTTQVHRTNARCRDYSFNEWSKTHYTNVFQNQRSHREHLNQQKFINHYVNQQRSYSSLIFVTSIIVITLIYLFEEIKPNIKEKLEDKKFSSKNG